MAFVDDEAGFRAVWFADVLDRNVVDRDVRRILELGIIGGQGRRFKERLLGRMIAFDYDMRTGYIFRMQPNIRFFCRLQRQLVVLHIVLSDQDGRAVR